MQSQRGAERRLVGSDGRRGVHGGGMGHRSYGAGEKKGPIPGEASRQSRRPSEPTTHKRPLVYRMEVSGKASPPDSSDGRRGVEGHAARTATVTMQAGGQNVEPGPPNAEERTPAVPRRGPSTSVLAAWLSNRASVSIAASPKRGRRPSELSESLPCNAQVVDPGTRPAPRSQQSTPKRSVKAAL